MEAEPPPIHLKMCSLFHILRPEDSAQWLRQESLRRSRWSFWRPPPSNSWSWGYDGVTPGLKAFPSCLIDNNALARTFLPGRSGTAVSASTVCAAATTANSLGTVVYVARRRWKSGGDDGKIRRRRNILARSWQCWPMAWRLWQTAVVAQCQFLTILCDSRRALSIFFDYFVVVAFFFAASFTTVVVWLQFSVKQPQLLDHGWLWHQSLLIHKKALLKKCSEVLSLPDFWQLFGIKSESYFSSVLWVF